MPPLIYHIRFPTCLTTACSRQWAQLVLTAFGAKSGTLISAFGLPDRSIPRYSPIHLSDNTSGPSGIRQVLEPPFLSLIGPPPLPLAKNWNERILGGLWSRLSDRGLHALCFYLLLDQHYVITCYIMSKHICFLHIPPWRCTRVASSDFLFHSSSYQSLRNKNDEIKSQIPNQPNKFDNSFKSMPLWEPSKAGQTLILTRKKAGGCA